MTLKTNLRAIAFYLPQFHPIHENNEFWGEGFTEWTNVTQAKSRFKNHYQPHLPSDLGFYDLRLSEARLIQEEYAKTYGIHGFCYYHYWFKGKKVLNEPLDRKLNNKDEDLPFMICWANENWTRNWDGQDHQVLLEQSYSEEDDELHFLDFLTYFKDNRYIKVDGKPVLMIYRTSLFPNIQNTATAWRKLALENGLPGIYLMAVKGINKLNSSPSEIGFDAIVDFQPDFGKGYTPNKPTLFERLTDSSMFGQSLAGGDRIYNYDEMVDLAINTPFPDWKFYPCICPSWDNTARRKSGATIFINASPLKYRKWLDATIRRFKPFSSDENFIFINAWNEWAEGNHLEPCRKWGRSYLEQTALGLDV